jgi:hypothetical protein
MGNESSRWAAPLVAVFLFAPLLVGVSYVIAYFTCSGSAPWHSERIFSSQRQFDIFIPLGRLESRLTGRDISIGYEDRLGIIEIAANPDPASANVDDVCAEGAP